MSTSKAAYAVLATAILGCLQAAAEEPRITSEWLDHLGPSRGFADLSKTELVSDISKAKLVWQSEEGGIGFGKSHSKGMYGYPQAGALPPSGAASPILAGGLVIQAYFLPTGPVASSMPTNLLPQFKSYWTISADDVVIAIDAATGKTRWKQVFKDKGRNYGSGKRGEWNVTPCSADGKVFAMGTTGRIYAMELATGKALWESNIGPLHEKIEQAKVVALEQLNRDKFGWYRPYGMLLVADGVLLVPDYGSGVLGVDPQTGKTLWHTNDKNGLTSGFNSPVPVTVAGKSFVACVNSSGDLRLVDHRTGKVLWTHALNCSHMTQPVFGKELLLAFERNNAPELKDHWLHGKGNGLGVLAGYRLSETGATKVWQLDPVKYVSDLHLDAGPARKIATRRDGIVYHWHHEGEKKLLAVDEISGKVLAQTDHFGNIAYVWGNRVYNPGDIQHGGHTKWITVNADPASFTKLGEGKFPSDFGRVCGYEVPRYDIFADGFMFDREHQHCRELNMPGWGGIRCYDMRSSENLSLAKNGVVARASSEYSAEPNCAAEVIDGITVYNHKSNNRWHADFNAKLPQWIEIELPVAKVAGRVIIHFADPNGHPQDFRILATVPGKKEPVELFNEKGYLDSSTFHRSFEPTEVKSVRLIIDRTGGGYAQICEFGLYAPIK